MPPQTSQKLNPKQSGQILKGILLLAFVLRLFALFQSSQSTGLSSVEAQNISSSLLPFYDIAFHLAHHDVQPPLYPLLLSTLSTFSSNELWLRLSSVGLGLYLVYWSSRLGNYWNSKTGLITAFIIAVSPPFIEASIEITHVTWLSLLGIMSLYYFWQWIQTRRFESLLIYETLILMALYTSYAGLFWLVAFNLAFFGSYWVHRAFYEIFWKRWLINQVLLIFLYLPWAIYLPEQIQRLWTASTSNNSSEALFSNDLWLAVLSFGFLSFTFLFLSFLFLSFFHGKEIRHPKAPTMATRHLSLILMTGFMLVSCILLNSSPIGASKILEPISLYALMAVFSAYFLSELLGYLHPSLQKDLSAK